MWFERITEKTTSKHTKKRGVNAVISQLQSNRQQASVSELAEKNFRQLKSFCIISKANATFSAKTE